MTHGEVVKFKNMFPWINLKLMNENPKEYDYFILKLYLMELKTGFKVGRINKTNNKGTKVTYEIIENKEEALKYKELIENKVKEFNEKYNEKLRVMYS